MGVEDMSGIEARAKTIRAGVRVNSRVPVAVEWTESGRVMRVEGYTVDASTKGCLAVVPQGFAVGQRLRLINLVNKNECQALLIWRGHEGRTGWELGLELQGASMEFWGLDF
ncbi:MAG: PilZ domain-containing protein [Candidatus Acidiferrum sp.]